MAFGIYLHFPYCIQRCPYCDFATYEQHKIPPPTDYIELIKKEIIQNQIHATPQKLDTLFLGGGTPSLMEPTLLEEALDTLTARGFTFDNSTEMTIEINPATLNPSKIKNFVDLGVNRFSVGAQTFNEGLLKKIGRKHSAQDTLETIELLQKYGVSYSLDLLYALPDQSLSLLMDDLKIFTRLSPSHISCYCLTLSKTNPLFTKQPPEETQREMIQLVIHFLKEHGFEHYEISNFSKPNMNSRHNMLYWTDQPYWGIGLSAHSYFKNTPWGERLWNPKTYPEYAHWVNSNNSLPSSQQEQLQKHEALTDYCHTHLRLLKGLSLVALQNKFDIPTLQVVTPRLEALFSGGFLKKSDSNYCFTDEGLLISNKIFQELTFLREDLHNMN